MHVKTSKQMKQNIMPLINLEKANVIGEFSIYIMLISLQQVLLKIP